MATVLITLYGYRSMYVTWCSTSCLCSAT